MAVLPALSIGSFAHDIVAGGGDATVIAVFDRSFYMLCPKGIVAVCDEILGRGPINILITQAGRWTGRVRVGMTAKLDGSALTCVDGPVVRWADASVWAPPPWPDWDDGAVRRGIGTVRALAQQALLRGKVRGLDQGLAARLLGVDLGRAGNPMLEGADELLSTFTSALPEALASRRWPAEAMSAATLLVGLGPGLTPSGDDVLGGLMLALTARGELRVRDQLWDHLVDELDDLTVPVSAMHLTAAAHGMGHEAIHALIDGILRGGDDRADTRLDAVLALGATSGIDAVAGVLTGLSA